ncbi:MAG TPA: NifB/NifX family molybdenum-iron cluster-binding protein, partial [Spirochaetales bacterium]|nr:NifB/NifX family molybdenum-iron cluster-binding protein [Spirochaetales bacterium]
GRRRVADALLNGKALRIEGGQVLITEDEMTHRKIALPTRAGQIDAHFGHCEYFTVYDVENGAVAGEKRVDSPDGCGCKTDIASVLAKDGVTLMLAGNMGDGAVRVLKANGIEVVRGTAGPVRSVVDAYLAGKLHDSGEGCAEHGGHDCSH